MHESGAYVALNVAEADLSLCFSALWTFVCVFEDKEMTC